MNNSWKSKKNRGKKSKKRGGGGAPSKKGIHKSKKALSPEKKDQGGLVRRRVLTLTSKDSTDPTSTKSYGPRRGPKAEATFQDPSAKKIHALFYKTFAEAYKDEEAIKSAAELCDQLNVVIDEEGEMADPKLAAYASEVRVFAGEAWALIHKRRELDGWYAEPTDKVDENSV